MFTQWLLAQREMSGEVGLAGKLAWAEINNGMVARKDHPLFSGKSTLSIEADLICSGYFLLPI
jgi:hypothetical protein